MTWTWFYHGGRQHYKRLWCRKLARQLIACKSIQGEGAEVEMLEESVKAAMAYNSEPFPTLGDLVSRLRNPTGEFRVVIIYAFYYFAFWTFCGKYAQTGSHFYNFPDNIQKRDLTMISRLLWVEYSHPRTWTKINTSLLVYTQLFPG